MIKIAFAFVSGLTLVLAVMEVGFIEVDDATYRAWRMVWAVGAGWGLAAGCALLILGCVLAAEHLCKARSK